MEWKEYCFDTVIVGSGAAAYNAAHELLTHGHRRLALITADRLAGTSRNAGSDKQTYYKLDLVRGDSVSAMARTLFDGGSVNGDTALAEAAGSARSFFKLVQLGVPFPCDAYGQYVGYQTDHDSTHRATSAGPYTSRLMTQALEQEALRLGLEIHNRTTVLLAVHRQNRVSGIICLNTENPEQPYFVLYRCANLILATGGPATVYGRTVYPSGQTGALGMMAASGIRLTNLAEWQFGLASLKFRWNVSGSYQQALPRYVSVDQEGREYDFLSDAYPDPEEQLRLIFLKGYQWPFDVRKASDSSGIDLLVHREIHEKGRRVFLDFTQNPHGLDGPDFFALPREARQYLQKSGALCGTPVERLTAMNPDAAALYLEHGIDLRQERLEIGLCAQHCNGGAWVDRNWQTNIDGIYCIGEAAGTFGVYRPGGSALNSGQVGACRAADHILHTGRTVPPQPDCTTEVFLLERLLQSAPDTDALNAICTQSQGSMDQYFSIRRDQTSMEQALGDLQRCVSRMQQGKGAGGNPLRLFHTWDMLLAQFAVASAMIEGAERNGSRGAALVVKNGHIRPEWRPGRGYTLCSVMTAVLPEIRMEHYAEPCRPLPDPELWFEAVWRDYRDRQQNTTERGEE